MRTLSLSLSLAGLALALPGTAQAEDLCKGRKPGTISFYAEEIARDKPLPAAVTELSVGKPMFALACLTDPVGPQAEGGTTFRAVLYVKATKTEAYSSFASGKQLGVLRPSLLSPVLLF